MPQNNLPLLYHMHHGQHMEDLPFWLDLAEYKSGPVLELGCGTGRILLPLVLAGYEAVGLDLDPGMLAFLKSRWPIAHDNPPVFQADMGHFHLAYQFPLILLPCNTLSTLSSQTRNGMFDCVVAQLAPNGLFSASLPNPQLLSDLPAYSDSEIEDIFYSPLNGEPIQVSSAWERSAGSFTVIWHYDQLKPDGRVERITIKTHHTLTPADTYLDELMQVGFDSITVYGDFDHSPYTSNSPNLIIVAAGPG